MKDNNYGLFKIEPRENAKPDKLPMDIASGRYPVSAQKNFVYSREEALAVHGPRPRDDMFIGYLPRDGSTWVGLDLDNCLSEDSQIVPWARDILGTITTQAETPSGKGFRLIMPRAAGDAERSTGNDINDVGFYAAATRAFTVPIEHVENMTPDDNWLKRDDDVIKRLLKRHGGSPQQGDATAAKRFAEKWRRHWFPELESHSQKECVEAMLDCLPRVFVTQRDQWTLISMCLHQLQMHVSWDVGDVWDTWSMKSNGYHSKENSEQWDTYKDDRGVSFFSLLHHAEENGFDKPYWMRMSKMQAAERRRKQMMNFRKGAA